MLQTRLFRLPKSPLKYLKRSFERLFLPGFSAIFSTASLATRGFLSRIIPSVFPRSKQVKSTSSFCSLTSLAKISSRPTVSSVTPVNLTIRSIAPSSRLSSLFSSFFRPIMFKIRILHSCFLYLAWLRPFLTRSRLLWSF